jgi:hypothetical protein
MNLQRLKVGFLFLFKNKKRRKTPLLLITTMTVGKREEKMFCQFFPSDIFFTFLSCNSTLSLLGNFERTKIFGQFFINLKL